ncbi:MAG: hypothetical protein BWY04_01414 [candidate division CPR1 bacterium ADurb.Bin160]|uniref:Uncharacterized protein n=1 Tax=candidate division CPR1 bacterium ADurb.Bin160 TaxID=1852826 RepID=A0A1V5ZJ62_9BACT|nr:MAG: hypothetical protein BWY04_01414 [candidate division CPR1 bacterium ADurb.Bin160]
MLKKKVVVNNDEVKTPEYNQAEQLAKELIKDKRKAQKELNETRKKKNPYKNAKLKINYQLDEDKVLEFELEKEVITNVQEAFIDLYIELLKSLNEVASITDTTKEE